MIIEALGSVVLGLAVAFAATKRLPERLPDRRLVLVTGPVAALVGGLVSRAVLGPGQLPLTLFVAAVVSVAILSLLIGEHTRPTGVRTEVAGPPHA